MEPHLADRRGRSCRRSTRSAAPTERPVEDARRLKDDEDPTARAISSELSVRSRSPRSRRPNEFGRRPATPRCRPRRDFRQGIKTYVRRNAEREAA